MGMGLKDWHLPSFRLGNPCAKSVHFLSVKLVHTRGFRSLAFLAEVFRFRNWYFQAFLLL